MYWAGVDELVAAAGNRPVRSDYTGGRHRRSGRAHGAGRLAAFDAEDQLVVDYEGQFQHGLFHGRGRLRVFSRSIGGHLLLVLEHDGHFRSGGVDGDGRRRELDSTGCLRASATGRFARRGLVAGTRTRRDDGQPGLFVVTETAADRFTPDGRGDGPVCVERVTVLLDDLCAREVDTDDARVLEQTLYVGPLVAGARTGPHGRLLLDNGELLLGTFRDGLLQGRQCARISDSCIQVGSMDRGRLHGLGARLSLPGGDLWSGRFEEGRLHGFGMHIDDNRSKTYGFFQHGVLHGIGSRTHGPRGVTCGQFVDGRFDGEAFFVPSPAGRVERQVWRLGELQTSQPTEVNAFAHELEMVPQVAPVSDPGRRLVDGGLLPPPSICSPLLYLDDRHESLDVLLQRGKDQYASILDGVSPRERYLSQRTVALFMTLANTERMGVAQAPMRPEFHSAEAYLRTRRGMALVPVETADDRKKKKRNQAKKLKRQTKKEEEEAKAPKVDAETLVSL